MQPEERIDPGKLGVFRPIDSRCSPAKPREEPRGFLSGENWTSFLVKMAVPGVATNAVRAKTGGERQNRTVDTRIFSPAQPSCSIMQNHGMPCKNRHFPLPRESLSCSKMQHPCAAVYRKCTGRCYCGRADMHIRVQRPLTKFCPAPCRQKRSCI